MERHNNGLFSRIRENWNPRPVKEPKVDPDLTHLTGLQRAVEAFRYTLLSLEWWLSPNGKLREWLRFNGRISSVLLVPAVLVVPLVTFILWQVAGWLSMLVGLAGNLILLPILTVLAIGAIAGAIMLLKILLGK